MKNNKHIFWGSSYDRGLDRILFIWPDILVMHPTAQLHIAYGWDLFDIANGNNPERMQWKENVQTMMKQKGVHHHGRVGKEELRKLRKKCSVWAYPTHFPEINCITALECQRDGAVPVVTNNFALKETVGAGVKIEGNIEESKVFDQFKNELIALLSDSKRLREEQLKGQKFAKDYEWEKIADKWTKVFEKEISTPFVSVITPTIRDGWWNIMANNLANQTYWNFEWVILDDSNEDRSEVAKKYAEDYDLNIKYVRGDKALGLYDKPHGLARANNKAIDSANGELLVWVQDFVLPPLNGLESLVDLYRHNPDALIAPVDEAYYATDPDKSNAEDWWNNNTNPLKGMSWRNIRVKFEGIRETDNPQDFELNYGAIPTHILKHLNGFYEFFDDTKGLGFDNTEIAHRALSEGFRIIIDDTNVAKCIEVGSAEADFTKWEKFVNGNYPNIREVAKDK